MAGDTAYRGRCSSLVLCGVASVGLGGVTRRNLSRAKYSKSVGGGSFCSNSFRAAARMVGFSRVLCRLIPAFYVNGCVGCVDFLKLMLACWSI
jgi:hypothetical protein